MLQILKVELTLPSALQSAGGPRPRSGALLPCSRSTGVNSSLGTKVPWFRTKALSANAATSTNDSVKVSFFGKGPGGFSAGAAARREALDGRLCCWHQAGEIGDGNQWFSPGWASWTVQAPSMTQAIVKTLNAITKSMPTCGADAAEAVASPADWMDARSGLPSKSDSRSRPGKWPPVRYASCSCSRPSPLLPPGR